MAIFRRKPGGALDQLPANAGCVTSDRGERRKERCAAARGIGVDPVPVVGAEVPRTYHMASSIGGTAGWAVGVRLPSAVVSVEAGVPSC